jgi:exodeoxyribonuclease V gamma subunit
VFCLHYSNRFEALAARLDEEAGGAGDPLRTHTVIVPNRAVASYLKLALAERRGALIGFEWWFFEAFVKARLEAAGKSDSLTRDSMQVALCARLADRDLLVEPVLAPVHHYIQEDERRRFELAKKLAGFFDRYAKNHPEWMAVKKGANETEAFQKRLWDVVSAGGRRRHVLAEVLATDVEALGVPETLHVIGFSSLAKAELAALEHMAQAANVHVYADNPCRQFWEDAVKDGTGAPALRLWGRAKNAALRDLNQVVDWDFDDAFVDPPGASALETLQRSLLDDAPATLTGDASLRVLACPSPKREIEIVANEIHLRLQADENLRLNQIALLVAGDAQDAYHAHIGVTFREFGIPFHIMDRPLARDSRLCEAIDLLLDLPLGTFTRPELLRLLIHPAVVARFPYVDPDDWVEWVDRLGIVHGADRSDHAHTYIERDLYHWDQGIRRLAFGAFMDASGKGIVKAGNNRFVPEEVPSDRLRSAGQFAALTRALIAEARALRAETHTLADWGVRFDRLAARFLFAVEEFEQNHFERCRDTLRQLGGQSDDEFGFVTAREFARQALAAQRSARGEPLAEGVMVARLSADNALPFDTVFVAGLEERAFPSSDRPDALDVFAGRPGELSDRDRDHAAFLQTLVGARKQLTLCYVDRDAQTGERKPPSSLVAELAAMSGAAIERHPQRRFDPAYFANAAWPDATGRRQAEALSARQSLERHLAQSGVAVPDRYVLQDGIARYHPALGRRLGISMVPETAAPAPATTELSLSRLRRFLECPFQAWAASVVGLRDVDHADVVRESHEPFAFERQSEVGWLRAILTSYLLDPKAGDLEGRYREFFELRELSGHTPTGLFVDTFRTRHLDILERWRAQIEALARGAPIHQDVFGEASERAQTGTRRPRIALRRGEYVFDLIGQTELLIGDAGAVTVIDKKRAAPTHPLRGYLSVVARAAAGLAVDRAQSVWVLAEEGVKTQIVPAWSAARAEDYLSGLAQELFSRSHDYFLPFEVVAEKLKHESRPLAAIAGPYLSGKKVCATAFGPIQHYATLPIPKDGDAEEMIARRYVGFFAEAA